MEKNDGGPAFPTLKRLDKVSAPELYAVNTPGMSLRDWFAGQADVSAYKPAETFEGNYGRGPTTDELADYIAQIRLMEADAMLRQRAHPSLSGNRSEK